jgi:hypothetical protein
MGGTRHERGPAPVTEAGDGGLVRAAGNRAPGYAAGGSWLNLTESVQRILVRRALAGQHLESGAEVREALGQPLVPAP